MIGVSQLESYNTLLVLGGISYKWAGKRIFYSLMLLKKKKFFFFFFFFFFKFKKKDFY